MKNIGKFSVLVHYFGRENVKENDRDVREMSVRDERFLRPRSLG